MPGQPGHAGIRGNVQGADQGAAPVAHGHARRQLQRYRRVRSDSLRWRDPRALQRKRMAGVSQQQAQRSDIEAGKMKIEWGSQIRNYVMHPYKLVKDVRSGYESSDVEGIMNGEIDNFLKAYLMMMGQKEE